MNDPIMDGLNENLPQLTGDFLNGLQQLKDEAAARQQGLTDPNAVDQGQTEQTQQPTSTESSTEQSNVPEKIDGQALSRKDNRERINEKIRKGEKVTFADTFSHNRADLRNPLNAPK